MVWTLHLRLFCSSWLFNTDPHAWLHVRHVQSSTCILCRLKLLLLQTLDAGMSEFIHKTINTQSLFTAPLWPFTVKDGVCRRWDVSQPAKKPPSSPKVLDLSSRKNGWQIVMTLFYLSRLLHGLMRRNPPPWRCGHMQMKNELLGLWTGDNYVKPFLINYSCAVCGPCVEKTHTPTADKNILMPC